MKIVVMNKSEAEKYALTIHKLNSVVVSISSYGVGKAFIVPNNAAKVKDVLFVEFNDTDSTDIASGGISEIEAYRIHKFVDRYINDDTIDLLIFQCEAGQSRSAGVAAATMKFYTGRDEMIFNNPKYTPNMLVYRTMLNEYYNS